MQALALCGVERLELRELPLPALEPWEVRLQVGGVGLCGTDFHIYGGHANYTSDEAGRPIPFEVRPLIMGHEFSGVVVETLGA